MPGSTPSCTTAGLVLVRALAVADDGYVVVHTNQGLALLKPRE